MADITSIRKAGKERLRVSLILTCIPIAPIIRTPIPPAPIKARFASVLKILMTKSAAKPILRKPIIGTNQVGKP